MKTAKIYTYIDSDGNKVPYDPKKVKGIPADLLGNDTPRKTTKKKK
jgi:hypothetical protein